MASNKRLSRTSGNKKITLFGGVKLCDTITLNSSEEKSPSPSDVFVEGRMTKDDASIPTTSKFATVKRSVSMNNALLGEKAPNRMQLGAGKLPIIEDRVEDYDDPSMHVLCPSTSSESGDEGTLTRTTDVHASTTVHQTKSEDKDRPAKVDDTFVVRPSSSKTVTGEKKAQLEEMTSQTWELRNFTANYHRYLDNESKYSEDNEAAPVKTSLIQIGEKIGCQSIFLANLYFNQSEESDINQNQEGRVNLNLEKGARRASASYEANPLENTNILVSVTVKMVDNFTEHQGTLLHYRVDLESSGQMIASFVQLLTPIKVGGLTSVAVQLDMKRFFSKMSPEDDLQIKLLCSVYRPMIDWGLTSKDSSELDAFMRAGKVEKANRRKVSELSEKCKVLNLMGIVECLDCLLPHKFFDEDE